MFKKELLIFSLLFIFLALGMHMNEWFMHPFKHLEQLGQSKMPLHPLLYTTLLYFIIGIIRLIFFYITKPFKKSR